MRVFYRVRKSPRKPTVYQQKAVVFCCEEIRRRWGDVLGFGVKGSVASTSRDASLFIPRQQANDKTILEIVPLAYCPWCGESVEVCRAAAVTGVVAIVQ